MTLQPRHALLQWITPQELAALRDALVRGGLPYDFVGKLRRLGGGSLGHRFVEQNCRLFASLLMASEAGSFGAARPQERERLLRVLAYVHKEEDAIPDYLGEGFADDQREVRAATLELGDLLQAFKVWRLRHQVPAMWSDHRPEHLGIVNS